ncbi:AraC family transcriptional regulator [Variovorax sp.]|uniref:AraC family transcriptional regulator n=1 Tax=Variovorax sp. TaxID=1871043 RepID=UPI002D2516C8|nr:AraC family transcriptional regulator [Variovorax sp.]HYP84256.1 AraC family transcriptional regulator [Variovorax sp.]
MPIESLPTSWRVAPLTLRPLFDEARRQGIDVEGVCQGLAFTPGDLDNPRFCLPHDRAVEAARRVLCLTGDASLGAVLGARTNLASRGILALGLMASSALGEAVDLALRYPRSAGFLLAVRQQAAAPGRHVLLAEPLPNCADVAAFLADKLLVGMVSILRHLAGAHYTPLAIEFVHRQPARAHLFEDFAGCPVRFGCRHNRLISEASWMAAPIPTANARSYRLACHLLEQEEHFLRTRCPVVEAAERMMRHALPSMPTLAALAAALNLSERTFRRRLAEAGTNYHALADEVRKARALELITDGGMTISRTAAEAGFGDLRSFRRAFKRWTGTCPSEAFARD